MRIILLASMLFFMLSCGRKSGTNKSECCAADKVAEQCCLESGQKTNCKKNKDMKYSKNFTNADFYKDGEFQQDVAIAAMKDMLSFDDVPFTELMAKDFWVTDFGLGDFEKVGMGGIFWVNDAEFGYFAHGIYLLPGQMIPEHAHVQTKFPAKHESWMVDKGWVYNFSEVGEETPDAPVIPASHGVIKSKNFVVQNIGDVLRLKELGTFHFMMAGPHGAIVNEWACYHDNDGLRFTNKKASL